MSERDIQRGGRWESDAYNVNTRNNAEDAGQVSSKLAREGTESLREPDQGTVRNKPQL